MKAKGSIGFTLIETLIALTIMAIVMTTILNSIGQAISTAARRTVYLEMSMCVQQVIQEIYAGIITPKAEEPTMRKCSNSAFTVSYTAIPLSKDSFLKDLPGLTHVQLTSKESRQPARSEQFDIFVFNAPQPEKKNSVPPSQGKSS